MNNHFHLVLEAPAGNLVAGMRWFLSTTPLGMLAKYGWSNTDLKARRKGDVQKVRVAARLRKETTMTWQWIAERLTMGQWRSARNCRKDPSQTEMIK